MSREDGKFDSLRGSYCFQIRETRPHPVSFSPEEPEVVHLAEESDKIVRDLLSRYGMMITDIVDEIVSGRREKSSVTERIRNRYVVTSEIDNVHGQAFPFKITYKRDLDQREFPYVPLLYQQKLKTHDTTDHKPNLLEVAFNNGDIDRMSVETSRDKNNQYTTNLLLPPQLPIESVFATGDTSEVLYRGVDFFFQKNKQPEPDFLIRSHYVRPGGQWTPNDMPKAYQQLLSQQDNWSNAHPWEMFGKAFDSWKVANKATIEQLRRHYGSVDRNEYRFSNEEFRSNCCMPIIASTYTGLLTETFALIPEIN